MLVTWGFPIIITYLQIGISAWWDDMLFAEQLNIFRIIGPFRPLIYQHFLHTAFIVCVKKRAMHAK